jgi:peptide/nickel transport system permease protein
MSWRRGPGGVTGHGGVDEDPVYSTVTASTPMPIGLEAVSPDEMTGIPTGGEARGTGNLGVQILRVFVQNKLAVVGVAIIVFFVLFCFVGPHLYSTNQTNAQAALLYSNQNAPPGHGHPLGTDDTGFDLLGRLMFGGQASLTVGFLSAVVATVVGVLYGATAGFFGGPLDALMMRIVDVLLSIPVLFLLIALVTIFHASEVLLILVIAFVSWLIPARLIRGETLTLRVREYVQAVRVMGGSRTRIVGRHIVPNAVGTIVVFATFQIADSILLLAALGFIGLGIPPPGTDWGSMLSNGVNYALQGYWWEIYPAGLCIVLVVIAFNFIGDSLRDALEVRLQRR